MRAASPSVLQALVIAALLAGAPPPRADAEPPELSSEPAEQLYLDAFLNGIDEELIVHVERRLGMLFVGADDLAEIGVRRDDLPLGTDGSIALERIPGLRYDYRPLDQRLDLEVSDERLITQRLGYSRPSTAAPRSDTGVVLNYAMHLQHNRIALAQRPARLYGPLFDAGYGPMPVYSGAEFSRTYDRRNQSVALDGDLRVFSPLGLFVNRGYTTRQSGDAEYIRNDTFWTRSSVDPPRTFTVGDFIGSGLSWTRSLRLGGVRVARNFGVRPDLVTFPLPELGGSAVVPTTVDLYVNGIRQFSGETRAGPFVIADPPVLTGAGSVSIVYRDALGREVTATQPLYVDTRLLGKGLSDYALELGYPRHNYGSDSSDYASTAAAVASLRYGVSDGFTLEAHAERNVELDNVGVGGLLRFGRFGVVSAAFAVSAFDGDGPARGRQTSTGYQYIAGRWSLDVYDRETHGDYRDLGTLEGVPVAQRLTRVGLNFVFVASHALSVNYARQRGSPLGGSRIVALGYNSGWYGSRISTFVTAFRDLDLEDSDGAYVAVSVGFGGRSSVYSGVSRSGAERTAILGTNRPVDYDRGGIGWGMFTEQGNDGYRRDSARLDYRNRFGDWSALLEQTGTGETDRTGASLYGSGSLVYMRRQLLAARAIYDGFALVSTDGLADVPVLRENRLLGSTNEHGYLLVSDLPSYRTSQIAIDPLSLPIDVNVTAEHLQANPREQSGVLVEFPVERFRGATLVLVDEQRTPLPPGTRVTLLDTSESGLMGYDGQVFFPTLRPSNRVSAETDAGRCEVEVGFADAQAMQTLGPFVCATVAPP
ncbi:MAG TPA: fimbria/pilus outer membrane usher protein [Gammaproteobacteria bacterium]|nr:fimbria/pilus outer membrane usher protein [Gammaproteobacteria bacterium]